MIELYKSKIGLPVNKINGYICHSLYNPLKEAKRFVDQQIEDVQIHFIYGYGNGYIIDEFLNRIKDNNTYYIIIDPFIDISEKKSEHAKFLFFENIEQLRKDIDQYVDWQYNRKLTVSLNYDKMDLNKYKIFLEMFNEINHLSVVNENTINLFAEFWFENYLYNMKHLKKDSSLKVLEKYTDKAVVVASGGPSLTKQLRLVKKYRDNLILIAAGSTINSLLADNITPDIVVSIDGHVRNYEHFKEKEFNEDVKYIYNMYSYPKNRESFKKGFFFLDESSINLVSHLKEVSNNQEPVILQCGGSVAHFALSIANYISTGSISLIGQDLAYTNGESHAANNVFKKKIDDKNKDLFIIDGYNGDKVETDYMFLSFKRTFEDLIKVLDKDRIYNCTEGGALIEGYNNISFKQFCESYANDFNSVKNNKILEDKILTRNENIMEFIKKNIKIYEKIERVTKNNLYLLKTNKKDAHFPTNILKKMEKNDSIMKKLCVNDPIETAFRTVELNVLRNFKENKNETPRETYERIYDQNKYLYSETNKLAKKGKEILISIMKQGEKNEI